MMIDINYKMNILSLFDGMSCGQIALNLADIKYNNYYASEIDKHAIKVTQHNYPETIQLGDVRNIKGKDLPKIDLLMGGSPCQGFSFSGKMLAFDDPRSKLFFEFVRIMKECKPKYFLLENVKMKKEHLDIISDYLGVEPVFINSIFFSAQDRKRYYWTNIDILPYEDKKVFFSDIAIENGYVGAIRGRKINEFGKYDNSIKKYSQCLELRDDNKTNCLTTVNKDNVVLMKKLSNTTSCNLRYLYPIESERLQTVPDGYTNCVSDNKALKLLGNGWTVDVIAHIFNGINNKIETKSEDDFIIDWN